MILINELKGDIILKSGISINGDVLTKKMMLTGSLMNGGTRTFPSYTGDYTFIPTQEQQIIEIKDKRATDNIIIEPIPNNYGLITWNGSYLTVS